MDDQAERRAEDSCLLGKPNLELKKLRRKQTSRHAQQFYSPAM